MQALIDRVIEEIKKDILDGDLTAIDSLLTFVPKENLIAFLPEDEWERFENDYCCDNCGGGFAKEEMDFDVNDQDLCKDCNKEDSNPICGICGGDATICDGC
jgi:hypothetical protein